MCGFHQCRSRKKSGRICNFIVFGLCELQSKNILYFQFALEYPLVNHVIPWIWCMYLHPRYGRYFLYGTSWSNIYFGYEQNHCWKNIISCLFTFTFLFLCKITFLFHVGEPRTVDWKKILELCCQNLLEHFMKYDLQQGSWAGFWVLEVASLALQIQRKEIVLDYVSLLFATSRNEKYFERKYVSHNVMNLMIGYKLSFHRILIWFSKLSQKESQFEIASKVYR